MCFRVADSERPDYFDGHETKGYGFIYSNKSICEKLASIFSEIEQKSGDMSADDLRAFQKTLWDDRVGRLRLNPRYKPLDPEIKARHTHDPNDMTYRQIDFPPLPYPLPS